MRRSLHAQARSQIAANREIFAAEKCRQPCSILQSNFFLFFDIPIYPICDSPRIIIQIVIFPYPDFIFVFGIVLSVPCDCIIAYSMQNVNIFTTVRNKIGIIDKTDRQPLGRISETETFIFYGV